MTILRSLRRLAAALLLTAAVPATAGLTLQPTRTLDFTVAEGTWMQPDMSPDGRTILVDILGDIYAVDAAGGAARPVLAGQPFETHPVFAPDGKSFAFISDRSGITNLWVADADGGNPRQISQETRLNVMTSPAWSPDGRTLYVSRMIHSTLAFELWRFDVAAATGAAITKPVEIPDMDHRPNAIGVVAAPDGHTVYYGKKLGHTWTDNDPPVWSVARRDLVTGTEDVIIDGAGGAMSPALSHDGKRIAYAARAGRLDEIRLRDLATGEDRRIAFPVDRDGQEGGYYAGVTPRISFTPDDKALLTSVGGKLTRIDVTSGKATDIPFTAHVQLGLGPLDRVAQHEETGPVKVRVIQAPRLSPDGRTLAFTALGGLYVQGVAPGATPKRLTVEGQAFQPSWSPDGRTLTFVTWSAAEGGAIWTVPARGGRAKRLTDAPSFFTEPAFLPDGKTIVALSASNHERVRALNELSPARVTDVVRLPAAGGPVTLVAHSSSARLLRVDPTGQRVRFFGPDGIVSVALDGSGRHDEASVVVQPPGQYFDVPIPAEDLILDPAGTRAIVRTGQQVYLVELPQSDKAPQVDLTRTDAPAIRLTRQGADFLDWADDGNTILWSSGSTVRRIALTAVDRSAPGASEAKAAAIKAVVALPRDVPKGTIVLRGATALTMKGDAVIDNADIVIVDNRIGAIGPAGSVAVPAGATIRDVAGKFITPGFVDTHAHWFEIRRQVHEIGAWDFLINLAYGVTSGLDVQPFTSDVFAYQDMIDAGMMPGPRAYSTGPGIFRTSPGGSKADVAAVLTRYRDEFRTRNIKSYMVGDRDRRQYMVEAAQEVGMMPTTEGASDLDLNLSHFIDGFGGNEHALPVSPLHDDVVTLMAKSGTSYTPTLSVLYGGIPALFEDITANKMENDAKLRRFMPKEVFVEKRRNRKWRPETEQSYASFAADALRVQRAGGLVGIGSHGEVQGLGYHWELAAFASGGATPMEALHAATIGSATVIGRADDIGSLEPGKFADLLIMDADPRLGITNTLSIHWVMKNGRLYDAATLGEIWPRARPLNPAWYAGER